MFHAESRKTLQACVSILRLLYLSYIIDMYNDKLNWPREAEFEARQHASLTLSWAGARRGDPVVRADAHGAVEQLAEHRHLRVVVQRQRRARREAEHAYLQNTSATRPGRNHQTGRPSSSSEEEKQARVPRNRRTRGCARR